MLNIRSLKDLPKIIAIFVIISCIIVPSTLIVIWKTMTFRSESRRIETDFFTRQKIELKERIQNILVLIKTKQMVMETNGKAEIKNHVIDIHSILSRMHAEWHIKGNEEELRKLLLQNIQAVDDNYVKGEITVFNRAGDLVYPGVDKGPPKYDIRKIRDKNGELLVDTIIPTVTRFDDVFKTVSLDIGDNLETDHIIGYFRLFRPAGWVIGYIMDRKNMERSLQSEILQILQKFRYHETGYIFTINKNGYILSHGTQSGLIGKNVLKVQNKKGVYAGQMIVDAAKSNAQGGYCQYEWINPATGIHEPKITYSVIIPEWNWTIATGNYLNPVYAEISKNRQQLKHRLFTEIIINCVAWVLCLGGTWLFIVWWRRIFSIDFHAFVRFFQQAAHQNQKIESDILGIAECKTLAGYANEMVDTRRRALEALEKQRKRLVILNRAIEQSPVSIIITTPDGIIEYVNPYFEIISGFTAEETVGKNLRKFQTSRKSQPLYKEMWQTLNKGKPWFGEITSRRKDGSRYWEQVHISPVIDENNEIVHFVDVKADITEQKKALDQLYQAKQDAEAANVAKSQFLANMSHEIRTPMNGVIGMLDLLMDTHLTDEQSDLAKTAKVSASALLSIINDILDFSKIEAGKLEIEALDFNFRDMIEDLTEIMSVHAFNKGIELTGYVHPDVPSWVSGDPGRIKQILINLTGNGIKFTQKGSVTVSVNVKHQTRDEVELHIDVKDDGPGIPADRMDRLFKSFSQVDASNTRKHGGTGLGLVISKQLTEMMGGRIGVDSKPGQGTRFWFTLVLKKCAVPAHAQHFSPEIIRNKHILVIDENPANLEVFSAYLNKLDCRTETASSSEAGLDKLRSAAKTDPFDVAILDLMLQNPPGDFLGQMIKKDPLIHRTALIMVTSRGLRGDNQEMKTIGFAGYLTKPVKRQLLFECLVRVISRKPEKDTVSEDPEALVTRHTIREAEKENCRILVVEDNPVNQKVAVLMLKKMGYHADVATNGIEAVDALTRTPYDLVLMDQQMPEMDGLEATSTIRTSTRVINNKLPIIAMTANALKGDKERCLAAGMDDYLSKPVNPVQLKKKLEQWLCCSIKQ